MFSTAYKPGNSLLHRSDGRIKLAMLILWTAAFLAPGSLMVQLRSYSGLLLLICFNLSLREAFKPLKSIWPLLVLVFIITPPFHQGGSLLFQLGNWYRITPEGLREAGILIIRFSGITSLFFLFFRTTTIDTFILVLRWYGLPYNAALVITIAFRYIPSLINLYKNIQDAHALRRPPLQQGRIYNPFRRFTHLFPSLVSVMIHSIKSIPSLSMALEIRGFGRHNQRTTYRPLPPFTTVTKQFFGIIIVLSLLILSYLL